MDLLCGFHQIETDENDKEKTAFCAARRGLFQWKRMPFGLVNTPSTFQRTMSLVLAGLTWKQVLVYIDDIIVFNTDIDSHLATLATTT